MGAILARAELRNRAVGFPSIRLPGGPLLRPRYLLRHTFGGSNLTPSDLGPAFEAAAGTPVVNGGALSAADATTLIVRTTPLAANLTVEARINFGNSAGTTRAFYVQPRHLEAAGDAVRARLDRTAQTLTIVRLDGFVATTLATAGSLSLADDTEYVLRFAVKGSRLYAEACTGAGALIASATVTEPLYASQVGMRVALFDNVASPTIQVDDLQVWA